MQEDPGLHFVTTAYIVKDEAVLLVFHRGLQKWLAPGGHVRPGETPDDCIYREVVEETGLNIRLMDGDGNRRSYPGDGVTLLARPIAVQLETITAETQHVDFVYAAVALKEDHVVLSTRELHNAQWFSSAALSSDQTIPTNVRTIAMKALVLVGADRRAHPAGSS